ncbi:MAG: hypothetical protein JW976_13675 [Syntrophaceae bacterium]|nr:hypothetical protein [Syntrophaceae bacterium]
MNKDKTKETLAIKSIDDSINDYDKRPKIVSYLLGFLDKLISSAPVSSFLAFLEKIASNRKVVSFFVFSEKMASSRCLKWVVIALLPVIILLKYPVERSDYDLWWQMALGKYYLANHTLVVDHSIFSWTPADSDWIYNTCLGSIIIYIIYNFFGGFGLWVFQWFIFLGIFSAIYFFFRLIRQQFDVTSVTLIAVLGIACSISCNHYKPELFSALLGCWMGVILLCFKLTRRRFLLYLYPFIFALWVNLHGSFFLGLAFLSLAFSGELLNIIFFPKESFKIKDIAHFGAACVLSFAATLLNPYGIKYLLNIYNGLMTSKAYSLNIKYIQAYMSLWPYLNDIGISFFRTGQTAWIMLLMLFFICCLGLYELIKKRTFDFVAIIILFTFLGSMMAARASYIFPLTCFFAFFYEIHQMKLKSITSKATVLSLLVFIFFFINISYFTFRYKADNKWFGAGLDSFAPVKEVSFLKKYRLEGPIFNDYLIGGYLLWDLYPDYKVFIDPRHVPYSKQVAPDYWELVSKPATAEDITHFNIKYPFKTAIIHYRELPLIFDFLKAGWQLLYFEKNAVILVHKLMLSKIPTEVQFVDLGPMRFKDVKNPEVLLNVFSLYVNLNLPASLVIYDIYKKNVSDCYKPKADHLRVMEDDIRQKKLQLKIKS